MSSPEAIARVLLEEGAVVLRPNEPFTFASGIQSPIYCDNRILLSSLSAREVVLKSFEGCVSKWKPKQIAGVATAGIAWGAWLAQTHQLPFVYVRSEAKKHGKGNQIEGKVALDKPILLVEDLVSTGGSVFKAADALEKVGATVVGIACIFSYEFAEVAEQLEGRKFSLIPLVTLRTLLNAAKDMGVIDAKSAAAILAWQASPKTWLSR